MLAGIIPVFFAGAPVVTPPEEDAYHVERSLLFYDTANTYLTRTPTLATDRDRVTCSLWHKRADAGGGVQQMFVSAGSAATSRSQFTLTATDALQIAQVAAGSTVMNRISTTFFRDPNAWYHFVFAVDTTISSYRMWVNGVELTTWSTNTIPAAGTDTYWNSLQVHHIGRLQDGTLDLNGYLAELHMIDGQALDPSHFGELNPAGVWVPKAYAGLYGTNGYYLNFADNSDATAATLGKDQSGMSNLFTRSDDFSNAAWLKTNSPTLLAGQADPLGGTAAYKLTHGSGGPPTLQMRYDTTTGQTLTLVAYAKKLSSEIFQLSCSTGAAYARFNLTTGLVDTLTGTGGTDLAAAMVDAGGGWWKCSLTFTAGTTTAPNYMNVSAFTPPGTDLLIFRANLSLGDTVPRELQLTNGTAVPDKNFTPFNFI